MAMGDPYPIVTDAFLLQENARLRAELAAERERKKSYMQGEITEYDRAEKAEKRVSKLREVLEQFAAVYVDDTDADFWFIQPPIKVGDLRRARAVLKETEK
jgi:hypothetical protein